MADVLDKQDVRERQDGQPPEADERLKPEVALDEETRDAAIDLETAPHEAEHEEAVIVHTERVQKRPLYRRPAFLIIAALVLIIVAIVGLRYWLYARSHESTDDAFIDGRVVQISPKVSGYVAKVYVADNQQVKEGDLIAELDARDFQVRLDQARAALETGLAQQRQAQVGVELTRANTRANIQQAAAVVQQART